MLSKRFNLIPIPIINNTWRTADVVRSVRDYAIANPANPNPNHIFTMSEIIRYDTSPDGIVIIFDGVSSFSMESYDSGRSYTANSFGISSAVLSSVKFLPATLTTATVRRETIGMYVTMGLVGGQTILWVDALIEITTIRSVGGTPTTTTSPLSSIVRKRRGDGGGGGGLTPARIPAP